MKKMYAYMAMLLMAVMGTAALSSCESDDQYLSSLLTDRDWQGYLGAYYSDRWGVSGSEYQTVMRFTSSDAWATSGRGYELDYDTRSGYRYQNYAYCGFSWAIVDGDIILIYDDDMWAAVYIRDYRLTSGYFSGRIEDGTRRDILFEFEGIPFDEWDSYQRDHYDLHYYARTRGGEAVPADSVASAGAVPYVDNGKSILSGTFAEGMGTIRGDSVNFFQQ